VAIKKVYQTLEDRSNPDTIERDGPFICKRRNAWLGVGYYFWESFVENAHWWGKECNNYQHGYVICQAIYLFDEEKCFNLIDNYEHLRMYNDTIKIMEDNSIFNSDKTTVSRIIEYLRNTLRIFKYEAVRVYGVNSKSFKSFYSNTTIFDVYKPQKYLDSLPAIQVCFYTKQSLNLKNYKIVFPEEYIEGYLV
jgi:hypothetical protein